MNGALESDFAARKVGISQLITMLLLRHSAFLKIDANHPHREIIQQARDSAQAELEWRMLSTVGLLDWWDEHPQYIVGQSTSGDFMGFDRENHTAYAGTTHEVLSKLQRMHNDLHPE